MSEADARFTIKDSGERHEFDSGMVRDTSEGKTNFLSIRLGPMYRRWATHLTKGRAKYPDVAPGVPNWSLAEGKAELARARESAARHFESWLAGEKDEDHAAATFFNINLAEYVEEKLDAASIGMTPDGHFILPLSYVNLRGAATVSPTCVVKGGSTLCLDCAKVGRCLLGGRK